MALPQRVFIDTSELFPFTIMDVLLTLSKDFLFTWVWTDELLEEWEKVIVREGTRTPESAASVAATSMLWPALAEVASRPETTVRLYVDGQAARHTPVRFAAQHPQARVFRTEGGDRHPVRNHAKFLSVDARWILVTSANVSWSAENRNLELGVLHDDPDLAQTVERQWRAMEPTYFTRVSPPPNRAAAQRN